MLPASGTAHSSLPNRQNLHHGFKQAFPAATPPLSPSALDGLKVLELGQLIAGPFAAKIASLAKRFIKLHN